MERKEILYYLEKLNDMLKDKDIKGQIGLYGGTVMCIAYNARKSTKDIDAIFEPKQVIYGMAKKISERYKLEQDWLNDSVKGFVSDNKDMKIFKCFSNLTVYIPSAEYMLAMKCMSARLTGTKDTEDIIYLINYLKIKSVDDTVKVVEKYFPQNLIQPKMQYMLEELFDQRKVGVNHEYRRDDEVNIRKPGGF